MWITIDQFISDQISEKCLENFVPPKFTNFLLGKFYWSIINLASELKFVQMREKNSILEIEVPQCSLISMLLILTKKYFWS